MFQTINLTNFTLTCHGSCIIHEYMRITQEAKTSLKREYTLYANAIAFYKKALRELEHKHHLSTGVFLKRFESGRLADDADYFDWYAFAKLLSEWQQAQSAIRDAAR